MISNTRIITYIEFIKTLTGSSVGNDVCTNTHPANTPLSARCRFDADSVGNATRAINFCRPNCDFTISGRLRKIVIGPTPI